MPRPQPAETRRKLDRLSALRLDPARRAEYAAELIATERALDILYPALSSLEGYATTEHREPLLALYAWLDEQGARRDPGALLRAAIIRAARDLFHAGDTALLDRAARTFEPSMQEAGGPTILRATGLATLFAVDPALAALRAAQLAVDFRNTSDQNGEPAATAMRVLAAGGEHIALLALALQGAAFHAEPAAEAVRGLAEAPEPAAVAAATYALGDTRELVQLGLTDLVVSHLAASLVPVFEALLERSGIDVLRYAATSAVAAHRADLLAVTIAAADASSGQPRLTVLREALSLVPDPVARAACERIDTRLAPTNA